MDGENSVQDIERELHDMLRDIDSISVNSSKALEIIDARSTMRSQGASCFEASLECIKVIPRPSLNFDYVAVICIWKAASACISRSAVQLHARARNSCLIQNEFKGDAASFEAQFEAVADKLLGENVSFQFVCVCVCDSSFCICRSHC
jgi:hypothetical protein